MCGIGGVIRVTEAGAEPEPIPERWADLLVGGIAWRGPDGRGRFRDVATRTDGSRVEVVLAHARLSIIDIECGAQPMVSERGPRGGGRVAVIFNGRIYNHRELRAELAGAGHAFETDHSDTEVLLHGWRAWGDRLSDHLDGMCALALWDKDHAELVLMRDRSGEKPLYYALLDGGRTLAFASNVPTVLAVWRAAGGGKPTLDRDALVEWIRLGWGERLPIREVVEAQPRETMVFPARDERVGRGPQVVHRIELAGARGREARLDLDEVERLLVESLVGRTDADVPLGCFVSGGIDSSLLAVYVKKQLGRLTTMCVKFPVASYDESPYAAEVARIIGSDHVTIDVHPSAAEDMERIIRTMGLPFGDSSVLPTHWVCRAAKEHVKVALEGNGGDELFFGYNRHRACLMLRRVRPFLHLLPRRMPRSMLRSGTNLGRLARFVVTVRSLGYGSLLSWQIPDVARLIPSERERLRRMSFDLPDPAMDDFRSYLPFDLCRKGDTASMLAPIEVRAPFLSNDLISAAQREPIESLMLKGQLKGILRELLRRHIPSSIVDRPKHGFGVPVGEFFRTDFGGMGALLTDGLAGEKPFGRVHDVLEIDVGFVRTMMEEHMEGRREHSSRLFNLLSLALWSRSLAS